MNHLRLQHTVRLAYTLPIRCRQHSSTSSRLPVQLDLLERYRSLVATGQIKHDDNQIRVIMQLRRLQKTLVDYAPPAFAWRLLDQDRHTFHRDGDHDVPWWLYRKQEAEIVELDKALVKVKSHADEIEALSTPKGLMLIGPPGSGKSFLVDLWFSMIPTPYKIRRHYNELVLEVYRGVWEETQRRMSTTYASNIFVEKRQPWSTTVRDHWRDLINAGTLPSMWSRHSASSTTSANRDPTIAFTIARRLLLNHWLLVFDEIQLLDVSSATLLGDVLSWFWRLGGVVVATSNKVPDDLYRQGVSRERLEPFVEALKSRCPIFYMETDQDWRVVRGGLANGVGRTWFTPTQADQFERYLESLVQTTGGTVTSRELAVFGRVVPVLWVCGSTCKFDFSQLCGELYGTADYLTIASTFSTLIITSVPVLKLSERDHARRFISLIDALYECRCKLICTAAAEPDGIFFPDALSKGFDEDGQETDIMMIESVSESRDIYRPNVSSYQSPQMAQEHAAPQPIALDQLSIFSGEDEQFAFKRALSRLVEITSADYHVNEQWKPLPLTSRRWEDSSQNRLPLSQRASSPYSQPSSADFADEASYNGSHPRSPEEARPEPPRLKNEHVWGVRDDWGPRAKKWGQGSKVYDKP